MQQGTRIRPSEHGPIFSVIVPSFNRPELVIRAATSILRQTVDDFELIIVNDGSTAWYGGLARVLADSRVRIVNRPTNGGAGAARNSGIRASTGRIVAFLDDDDEYLPDFLEATLRQLSNDAEKRGASWSGVHWTDDVNLEGACTLIQEFPQVFDTDRSLFESFLSIGTGYGVCVTSDCLGKVGGFDEGLATVEDTDWFIRILAAGFRPVAVPGVHVIIHEHPGPRLTDRSMLRRNVAECDILIDRHGEFFESYPSLREQILAHKSAMLEKLESGADSSVPMEMIRSQISDRGLEL